MIFAEKYAQAAQVILDTMLGEFGESYLPLGDLLLHMHPQDTYMTKETSFLHYSRSLSLYDSIASVSYDYNGNHYTREYFASYVHLAIFISLTCSHQDRNLWTIVGVGY